MKRICAVLALVAAAAAVFAQNVAEDELRSVRDRTIEFINYEGPHTRVDTLEEIRGLGAALGRAVRAGAMRAGSEARYAVIRVRDASAPSGLDADILILVPGAVVDHIRNLRHILGAYLEEAYGYSRADAGVLATFLTVYNAVYRGNLEYFERRTNPPCFRTLLPRTRVFPCATMNGPVKPHRPSHTSRGGKVSPRHNGSPWWRASRRNRTPPSPSDRTWWTQGTVVEERKDRAGGREGKG